MSLNYKVIGKHIREVRQRNHLSQASATTFRKRCSLNWWIKRHLTSAT